MMDHDHHTLWNALCEATRLIHHTSLGWDDTAEHERACWDFIQRFNKHQDIKRIQKEVLRVNASDEPPPPRALSPADGKTP